MSPREGAEGPVQGPRGGSEPLPASAASSWRPLARRLVERIGVEDPRIASAMQEVPRHLFVGAEWRDQAYEDVALPVGPGATISAPHMVALQLQWARLGPGLRVLEVGSGCGYLLALLDRLVRPGGRVRGVEIEPELAERSRGNLRAVGAAGSVKVRAADGGEGWPEEAPFDRVVVSYATRSLLPAWEAQLNEGGSLLLPWTQSEGTYLERLLKRRGRLERETRGPPCLFVASKSEPSARS